MRPKYFIYLLISIILFVYGCENKPSTQPGDYDDIPQSDISIVRNNWNPCSIPEPSGKNLLSRGSLTWYNPYEQCQLNEIWPSLKISPDGPFRIHVLDLSFSPNDSGNFSALESWNGIMMLIPEDFQSQLSSFQYFEVTISGNQGIIHFDIGEISEDVIPNGKLNSEDKAVHGIRNGILDPGEDVGLDGMAGTDPSDFWDVNENNIRDAGEPISWDDWTYPTGGPNYEQINGTEGNEHDPGGKLPDTEDINLNGKLDLENNYYSYRINLDKSSSDTSMIVSANIATNWYTYGIDLSDPMLVIGDPNPWKPFFLRTWIDGCSTASNIRVALIDFKK